MNKKIKIFYIIDIFVLVISFIVMFILDNKKTYGLEALTSVGYFTCVGVIFIISAFLLVIVSLIRIVINLVNMKNIRKKCC